ncbi:MAG: mucoidy inhibitor MuiA family protein [Polyangiaceae bacterium]|nr:mucoidy inhibitor MuiA family protein [Polyangiaceae bacterium]
MGATETKELVSALAVSSVVVLEDRAQVVRKGAVDLKAGRTRIVVEGVAPVAVDKSLSVSSALAGVVVTDARIVRTPVFERAEALDDEIRRARAAVEDFEGKVRRLHREAYDTDRLLVSFLDEIAEDAAWARPMTERRSAYEELLRRSRALAEKVAEVATKLDDERRALERKVERRRALERPDVAVKARLEIDVEASKPGKADISAAYLVPNACWRPRHRVTLTEAPPSVSVETEGVVWQNTGEDWSKVKLALSTERASLGVMVPRLETDRLSTQKKGALVIESRNEEIAEAGLGAGAVEVRKTTEMPGIDDGGEAQHLTAEGSPDIPSDGRPHAVMLASFQAPAEVELVTMPELLAAALTKTTFVNKGDRPLLAGPVDLVRRGGAAGRTKIGFIGAGEKVAIGWGPEQGISVHREIEALKDETSFLGSWYTSAHDVRVRIANLGREPRTVVLKERVPVSEIEKVKIEVVGKETTGNNTPDKNGILTWKVELGGYAHKTVSVRVVQKKHADVVG